MGCISTILHRGSFTIPLPQVMHTQNIYIFASFITLVVCVAVGLEIYINSSPVFLALSLEQRQRCGASVIPVCGSIFSPVLRSLLLLCCGSTCFSYFGYGNFNLLKWQCHELFWHFFFTKRTHLGPC